MRSNQVYGGPDNTMVKQDDIIMTVNFFNSNLQNPNNSSFIKSVHSGCNSSITSDKKFPHFGLWAYNVATRYNLLGTPLGNS